LQRNRCHDINAALHGLPDLLAVEQVTLDEGEAAIFQRTGQKFLPAGDQIIETNDLVAVGQETVHQAAPNEPGAAVTKWRSMSDAALL
jgi:hypothetical protein